MLKIQKYRCGICGIVFEKTPHIDHNHETGIIRGLLCNQCNLLLGLAKENPLILLKAGRWIL